MFPFDLIKLIELKWAELHKKEFVLINSFIIDAALKVFWIPIEDKNLWANKG